MRSCTLWTFPPILQPSLFPAMADLRKIAPSSDVCCVTWVVKWLSCANTAERIKLLLGVTTLGNPRNIALDESPKRRKVLEVERNFAHCTAQERLIDIILFGLETLGNPSHIVLYGGSDAPTARRGGFNAAFGELLWPFVAVSVPYFTDYLSPSRSIACYCLHLPPVEPKACYPHFLFMISFPCVLMAWCSAYRSSRLDFLSHWDPYAVLSLEAVAYSSYCNTVEWFWWDWSLSSGQLASFSALTLLVGSFGL